ncbi:MAG: GNAT family N-acetyltransferase [Chloroflexota bacterium]
MRDNEGTFMGMAGLDAVHVDPGNLEVGFQLAVYAWRKGIATATCTFLTIVAFEELHTHKVVADGYFRHVGSLKTLEKCGYT